MLLQLLPAAVHDSSVLKALGAAGVTFSYTQYIGHYIIEIYNFALDQCTGQCTVVSKRGVTNAIPP